MPQESSDKAMDKEYIWRLKSWQTHIELLKEPKEENASSTTEAHPTRTSQFQSIESLHSNDEWECAVCGMRNSKRTNSCINCGHRRISP